MGKSLGGKKHLHDYKIDGLRFPNWYAKNRLQSVKICQKCNARNHARAIRCHKCGHRGLRYKRSAYK